LGKFNGCVAMPTYHVYLKIVLGALCSAAILCSCTALKQDAPPDFSVLTVAESQPEDTARQQLSTFTRRGDEILPGYRIRLTCSQDKKLNGKFRVKFDGQLKLPYHVTLQAAGLKSEELQRKIVQAYRPYFRSVPPISVQIDERLHYVAVQGLVEKPGQYLIKENGTLDELIAKAGGLQRDFSSRQLKARYARITKGDEVLFVNLADYYAGTAPELGLWQGGESVFFQTDGDLSATAAVRAVQILGQVVNPGEYNFSPEADFFYYLSKAGGPTERADLERIEIVRVVNHEKKSVVFRLKDASTLPKLRPGDIVMIPPEQPKTAISNFTSILTSISTAVIAAAAL